MGAMPAPRTEPGGDLVVSPGPGIPQGLVLPAADLVERFSRSSGPGGQGVNTTDSRAELRFDVVASTGLAGLTEAQQERVRSRLQPRMVGAEVIVVASEHRSQRQNRVAARVRLAALLREALAPPPPARRRTKPSRGAQQRRLTAKKQRGATKAGRGRVRGEP
jgi:ribosome-associated protein